MEELIDIPMALAWQPLPKGNKVGVVSVSGGACSIIADICEETGLEIPDFTEKTTRKIREIIPPFVSTRNPLDITGMILPGVATELGLFRRCIKEIAKDELIDMIIIIMTTILGPETKKIIEDIIEATKRVNRLGNPVLLTWTAAKSYISELIKSIVESRIPLYDTPEKAARAAEAMVTYKSFLRKKGIIS